MKRAATRSMVVTALVLIIIINFKLWLYNVQISDFDDVLFFAFFYIGRDSKGFPVIGDMLYTIFWQMILLYSFGNWYEKMFKDNEILLFSRVKERSKIYNVFFEELTIFTLATVLLATIPILMYCYLVKGSTFTAGYFTAFIVIVLILIYYSNVFSYYFESKYVSFVLLFMEICSWYFIKVGEGSHIFLLRDVFCEKKYSLNSNSYIICVVLLVFAYYLGKKKVSRKEII